MSVNENSRAGRAWRDFIIADSERRARKPLAANLAAIRAALEAAGVDLLPGGAVRRSGASASGGKWRLAVVLRALQAGVPTLRRVGVVTRQLGSVLRHGYDDVDVELLWRAVTERLDTLEAACRRELGDT